MIKLKRIYEKAEKSDGTRVLVDRLWPRGVSRRRAKLDVWLKDIAPSDALRKAYGHDPKKWVMFKKKYRTELKSNAQAVAQLKRLSRGKTVTLVFAARDEEHNEAVVIKSFLTR